MFEEQGGIPELGWILKETLILFLRILLKKLRAGSVC
jgi:hypothetical protein